jgi:hypothetical protein
MRDRGCHQRPEPAARTHSRRGGRSASPRPAVTRDHEQRRDRGRAEGEAGEAPHTNCSATSPRQAVPAAAVPATLASRGIGALPRTDHRRPLWTKRSSDWAPALARCPIPRTTVAICADRVRCAGCLDPALRLASGVRILRLLILHTREVAGSKPAAPTVVARLSAAGLVARGHVGGVATPSRAMKPPEPPRATQPLGRKGGRALAVAGSRSAGASSSSR